MLATCAVAAAIGARRDAGQGAKYRREVAGRTKSHRPRDLGDRQGVGRQQHLRLLDPPLNHESMRRHAGTLLEESCEVVGAHVHQGAELREAKLSMQIVLNVLRHSSEPALGQASAQTVTLTNQRAEIDILRRRMDASVLLVKAIGGGWDVAQLGARTTAQ